MSYSLKKRVPKGYPWKLAAELCSEFSTHVTSPSAVQLLKDITHYVRHRDLLNLKNMGDVLAAQCFVDQLVTAHEYRVLYQACSFIKKFPHDDVMSLEARKKVAYNSFDESEQKCAQVNHLLRAGKTALNGEFTSFQREALLYAKLFISNVLSESVDVNEVLKNARSGKGNTVNGPSDGAVEGFYKLQRPEHWTVTQQALPYFKQWVYSDPVLFRIAFLHYRKAYGYDPITNNHLWLNRVVNIVDGNKLITVPKTAFTERLIAIEPGINLALQLGVESIPRRNLKRWGIDIDSQEKNQKLAREGSSSGTLTTIDLSAASDSISTALLEQLMPAEWLAILQDIRSPIGEVDGRTVTYEKISSMGNGTTFAVETLIFASLIYGAIKASGGEWENEKISVFGDDIIVPWQYSLAVTEMLQICGMTVNNEKSFFFGPFRESCGCDYWEGHNVRPVFMTSKLQYVDDLYVVHNRLSIWLLETYGFSQESSALSLLVSWLAPESRLWGPHTIEENTHLFALRMDFPQKARWRVLRRKPTRYCQALIAGEPLSGSCYIRSRLSESVTELNKTRHGVNYLDTRNIRNMVADGSVTRRDKFRFVTTVVRRPLWSTLHQNENSYA